MLYCYQTAHFHRASLTLPNVSAAKATSLDSQYLTAGGVSALGTNSQLCDRILYDCLLCIFALESSTVYLISFLQCKLPLLPRILEVCFLLL